MSKVLKGVAGEYSVAAELSKKGYIATITLRNTDGIDILASNKNASKTVAIQVKTTTNTSNSWILNEKADNYHSENLFYVFVILKEKSEFFIVPSEEVANYVKNKHIDYYSNKGKNPAEYSIRKFDDPEGKYLEKWDLLRLE